MEIEQISFYFNQNISIGFLYKQKRVNELTESKGMICTQRVGLGFRFKNKKQKQDNELTESKGMLCT